LREFATLDGFVNGGDKSAFRGELRRFGSRKADVSEYVTTALLNRNRIYRGVYLKVDN
jgi:hypothetical protein